MKTKNHPQILIPLILLTATTCVWIAFGTGGDKRDRDPVVPLQVLEKRGEVIRNKADRYLEQSGHFTRGIQGKSSLRPPPGASDRMAGGGIGCTHPLLARPVEVRLPEAEDFVMRQEARMLETGLRSLGEMFDEAPFERLTLPLFDGQVLLLDQVEHHATGPNRGLFTGVVPGEPGGGHVVLSYVDSAIAATVHLPARDEFYEIRTAPNGTSHILSRLDPTKMPPCGLCNH